MRHALPIGFMLFVAGGLLGGTMGVSNLALFVDRASPSETTASAKPSFPVALVPRVVPTPVPTAPALLPPVLVSSLDTHAAPTSANPWSFLYVLGGDLWVASGNMQFRLTQGAQISYPTVGDGAIAFVERGRNASDVWFASTDTPLGPVTHTASPIVSQNHWASQPVLIPGRQDLYVIGDFNKSSTGPGNLAIWELDLQKQSVVQITQPPEYAGGDQDVTVNPVDPRQIIFTRYSYAGTRLAEQLEWMDVTTNSPVALTQADRPARQASYAPDGTMLAFVQAGQGFNQDLWLAQVDASATGTRLQAARQIVSGVIAYPVWSPDGSELAYIALTRDQFQLWSVNLKRNNATGAIDSIGQPRQITSGPSVDATSRPAFLTGDRTEQIRDWLSGSVSS